MYNSVLPVMKGSNISFNIDLSHFLFSLQPFQNSGGMTLQEKMKRRMQIALSKNCKFIFLMLMETKIKSMPINLW